MLPLLVSAFQIGAGAKSEVIELVGKILFVLFFIPRFGYDAVILCEPIIWCFMTAELLFVYLRDPFVFPGRRKPRKE